MDNLLITRRSAGLAPRPACGNFPAASANRAKLLSNASTANWREELGIEIQIVSLAEDIVHHYPERSVRLKFFRCRWLRHEPRPILCESLAWITPAQLSEYPFPAADARLLDKLRQAPDMW